MSFQDLYQEIILDHGKNPRHTGTLPTITHQQMGHNPLCGDKVMLTLLIENDQVIDARFEGAGCAISMASASLMIESIKGKALEDTRSLFNQFHCLVTTGQAHQTLGKLMAFSEVHRFPIRIKCATLAWHALQSAIATEVTHVSSY